MIFNVCLKVLMIYLISNNKSLIYILIILLNSFLYYNNIFISMVDCIFV